MLTLQCLSLEFSSGRPATKGITVMQIQTSISMEVEVEAHALMRLLSHLNTGDETLEFVEPILPFLQMSSERLPRLMQATAHVLARADERDVQYLIQAALEVKLRTRSSESNIGNRLQDATSRTSKCLIKCETSES